MKTLTSLSEAASQLCQEVEKLPAGEQQTKVSVMAAQIASSIREHASLSARVYPCPNCGDDVTFPDEHHNYASCKNYQKYWHASVDAEFEDGRWKDLTRLFEANPDHDAP